MNGLNFFAELKRRNDYKVAVADAVVGWLLIQVATQVFPFLEIPNGAFQVAVLYAIRKEPEQMFKWLETALATRDSGMAQLAITAFFLPYRDDPRFVALGHKLNVQLPTLPQKP